MASTLTDSVVLTYKGLEREFNGTETSTSEKLIGSRQAVVSAESLLVKGQISD